MCSTEQVGAQSHKLRFAVQFLPFGGVVSETPNDVTIRQRFLQSPVSQLVPSPPKSNTGTLP